MSAPVMLLFPFRRACTARPATAKSLPASCCRYALGARGGTACPSSRLSRQRTRMGCGSLAAPKPLVSKGTRYDAQLQQSSRTGFLYALPLFFFGLCCFGFSLRKTAFFAGELVSHPLGIIEAHCVSISSSCSSKSAIASSSVAPKPIFTRLKQEQSGSMQHTSFSVSGTKASQSYFLVAIGGGK